MLTSESFRRGSSDSPISRRPTPRGISHHSTVPQRPAKNPYLPIRAELSRRLESHERFEIDGRRHTTDSCPNSGTSLWDSAVSWLTTRSYGRRCAGRSDSSGWWRPRNPKRKPILLGGERGRTRRGRQMTYEFLSPHTPSFVQSLNHFHGRRITTHKRGYGSKARSLPNDSSGYSGSTMANRMIRISVRQRRVPRMVSLVPRPPEPSHKTRIPARQQQATIQDTSDVVQGDGGQRICRCPSLRTNSGTAHQNPSILMNTTAHL